MNRPPPVTNWARTIEFTAASVHEPRTVEQVVEAVTAAARQGVAVKALGTGHSFSTVADTTGLLLRSSGLRGAIEFDQQTGLVRCRSGVPFSNLAPVLQAAGRALPNLGSLPHISVGGAVSTGTHGSGRGNTVLAASVESFEIVRADGQVVEVQGAQVAEQAIGVGALGILTALSLRTVPSFSMRQVVYTGLGTAQLVAGLHDILGAGYSVSVFTNFQDSHEIWLKALADEPLPGDGWLDTRRAAEQRPAGPGADPASGTPQLGVVGPWHERLPHFRAQFRPSNGAEIQSEYFVAAEDGPAAIDAVCRLGPRIARLLQIGEIRAVAGDDLLLSGARGRPTVAIHFTWVRDAAAVLEALVPIEQALAPFAARPHWGKVFLTSPEQVAQLHPGARRFGALRAELDPDGVFDNAFLNRYLPRL